jgi:selenocysteine lyase/cysteine desulfurase
MPDWQAVRNEFPALQNWTYLNSATFGQLPRCASAAVQAHLACRDELACSNFLDWYNDADRIRADIGRLIHCQASDIAFFPNAAAGSSLLANAIDWQPGDQILTLEHEFPNQLYIAQAYPQAEAVIVPWPRFLESITSRTRLVMISTASYSTGQMPPCDQVAEACRKAGALFSLDGTQSLGALPFDVSAIQPDLFVVDGYKWLLSPNGATFAYIHPRVREWLRPNVFGWRSDKRWRQVNELHQGAPELKSDAERYEGGFLAFPSLYGMGASVRFLLDLGPEVIGARVLELAEYARQQLRQRTGAKLLADTNPLCNGPILAAHWPGVDSSGLSAQLKQRRILTSARHGNLRVSTHFYNNEQDIDTLCSAIQELVR